MTIEDTGFEIGELEAIKTDFEDGADPDDEIPSGALRGPAVLQPGDLLQLGNHRLLVGDARDLDALDQLCGGQQVAAALLDVPYNVRIRDIVGRGSIQHEEFAFASGEMSRPEFVDFLKQSLGRRPPGLPHRQRPTPGRRSITLFEACFIDDGPLAPAERRPS